MGAKLTSSLVGQTHTGLSIAHIQAGMGPVAEGCVAVNGCVQQVSYLPSATLTTA